MKIAVCCSTFGESRRADLARMCGSLEGQDCDVVVSHEMEPRSNSERFDSVLRRAIAETDADIFVHFQDDLEALPRCMEYVLRAFETYFPDGDGVVGLNQVNIPPVANCTEFGIFAIGRDFIENFHLLNKPVFCPEYWHFYCDTELGLFAKKIGKFIWAGNAQVVHWHRGVLGLAKDEAHVACRVRRDEDRRIWVERQSRGLLWGESFERIEN